MSLLRKSLLLMVPVCGLLLSSCTSPLLYEDALPEFKAPSDKALCVVIRQVRMFGNYTPIWVDQKLVSGTIGGTVTSFNVDPGEHLVITKVTVKTKLKYNFQAGKVYYILQTAWTVPMVGVMTGFTPLPADEAVALLEKEKGSVKYSRANPEYDGDDLSEDDVKEELEDYAEWAEKNPDKAKVEAEYPGY